MTKVIKFNQQAVYSRRMNAAQGQQGIAFLIEEDGKYCFLERGVKNILNRTDIPEQAKRLIVSRCGMYYPGEWKATTLVKEGWDYMLKRGAPVEESNALEILSVTGQGVGYWIENRIIPDPENGIEIE